MSTSGIESPRIRRSDGERGVGDVRAHDPRAGFQRQRDRDRARPGPDIDDVPRAQLQRRFDHVLGFGPRDQDVLRDAEIAAVEP